MYRLACFLVAALAGAAFHGAASAQDGGIFSFQDNDILSFHVGVYNITDFDDDDEDEDEDTVEGRLEYQSALRALSQGDFFRGFGPMIGLMANGDGGVFGYGGIFADLRFGNHVVLLPKAGIGGYSEGGSRDLGGVFQFSLGITAAYKFANESRLGVTYMHISNADLHDRNPGVDSVLLTYSLPIERLF